MNSPIKMEYGKFSDTFDKVLEKSFHFEVLPLMHSVDWYSANEILKNLRIDPTDCDVFEGQKLIYLFYGIPAYVVSQDVKSRGDSTYHPVCFMLDYEKTDSIVNVFPFDSGAFHLEMYSKHMHKKMKLYDFSLPINFDYIARFVSTFYSSNENYYYGKCKKDFSNLDYDPNKDFHISAYINLLQDMGEKSVDSRARTVELISNKSVDLKTSLKAIFAPNDFFRAHKEAANKLEMRGIKLIPYYVFCDDPPSSYNYVIKQLVFEYLKENKLI